MSECGRKIRNAYRMPKSDDRTESNLRSGRRNRTYEVGGGKEGRLEENKEEKKGGEVRKGEVEKREVRRGEVGKEKERRGGRLFST